MSLRDNAVKIVSRLQAAGFTAYWVGGCVRDSLLGRVPEDYDVATSATPGTWRSRGPITQSWISRRVAVSIPGPDTT